MKYKMLTQEDKRIKENQGKSIVHIKSQIFLYTEEKK